MSAEKPKLRLRQNQNGTKLQKDNIAIQDEEDEDDYGGYQNEDLLDDFIDLDEEAEHAEEEQFVMDSPTNVSKNGAAATTSASSKTQGGLRSSFRDNLRQTTAHKRERSGSSGSASKYSPDNVAN